MKVHRCWDDSVRARPSQKAPLAPQITSGSCCFSSRRLAFFLAACTTRHYKLYRNIVKAREISAECLITMTSGAADADTGTCPYLRIGTNFLCADRLRQTITMFHASDFNEPTSKPAVKCRNELKENAKRTFLHHSHPSIIIKQTFIFI